MHASYKDDRINAVINMDRLLLSKTNHQRSRQAMHVATSRNALILHYKPWQPKEFSVELNIATQEQYNQPMTYPLRDAMQNFFNL